MSILFVSFSTCFYDASACFSRVFFSCSILRGANSPLHVFPLAQIKKTNYSNILKHYIAVVSARAIQHRHRKLLSALFLRSDATFSNITTFRRCFACNTSEHLCFSFDDCSRLKISFSNCFFALHHLAFIV